MTLGKAQKPSFDDRRKLHYDAWRLARSYGHLFGIQQDKMTSKGQ